LDDGTEKKNKTKEESLKLLNGKKRKNDYFSKD